MKLNAQQLTIVTWTGLGVVGLGLAYLVISYAVPAFTRASRKALASTANDATGAVGDTLQGAISGLDTNALTQGGPDAGFGGDANYNYTGFGLLSTPAAVANKATGGLLADAGESLGGWLYDTFGAKPQ